MITEHRVTHRIADRAELLKEISSTIDGNFRMIHISKVPNEHINDGKGIFELEVLFKTAEPTQPEISFESVP